MSTGPDRNLVGYDGLEPQLRPWWQACCETHASGHPIPIALSHSAAYTIEHRGTPLSYGIGREPEPRGEPTQKVILVTTQKVRGSSPLLPISYSSWATPTSDPQK